MAKRQAVTFGAVGDIMFCNSAGKAMQARGTSWLMEKVRPILAEANVLCGNMESITLPPNYPNKEIDPHGMVTKFDGTPALKEAGFDYMCLANNHALDGGTLGLFHTKKTIERLGIATGGVGRTQAEARRLVVLEKAGLRWGFLSYAEDCNYTYSAQGPGFAYYSREAALEDIARYRRSVDVLVVSNHADLEFEPTPCPQRCDDGRELARAGATLVLMHHPHVPQGIERIGRSLVAYSLGNFAFDAHSSGYMKRNGPYTALSFLLLAEVSRRGVESFRRVPIHIAEPPEERPAPVTGAAARKALAYFDRLDRAVADDATVARNWRGKCMKHFRHLMSQLRGLEDEKAVLHLLGKSLFVAENTSWTTECYRALQDYWRSNHGKVDRLHRPSRAFAHLLEPKQPKKK